MDERVELCHDIGTVRVGISDSLCWIALESGKATRNQQRVRRLRYRGNSREIPVRMRGPVTNLRARLPRMIGHS